MKIKKHIRCFLILSAVALFPAMCLHSCVDMNESDEISNEVRLQASLQPSLHASYTKGEIKSDHMEPLKIGLTKVYGEEGDFSNVEGYYDAMMGIPDEFGMRDIEFSEFQGFPDGVTLVNYAGWYPYEGSTFEDPEVGNAHVSFSLPEDASTDVLYTDVTSGNRSSGFNALTFRHALVKYSIKVYAMVDSENENTIEDVWGKIKSVQFEQMPKSCTISFPSSSDDLPSVSFSNETQGFTREATVETMPVGFSNAADLTYFLAPPPSDGILRIKVISEKDGTEIVQSQTLSIARNFQIGKHYQIILRFTTHGTINAEVVVQDWNIGQTLTMESNQGVYYNLSENQTANSYVISSAYSYCFDVTVKGNGYSGVAGIPGAQANLYMIEDPSSVEIVWTDLVSSENENLDDIFTLNPKVIEGRAYFDLKPAVGTESTLAKEGNILLGVRNSSGEMLWTWHIWITDRPNEQGYKNGFTVQDRDMGATAYDARTEPDGIDGLYYQWGRPTPLPLGKTVYRPVYNEYGVWTKNDEVDNFISSDESVSVIDRTGTPLVYYTTPATATDGSLTKSLWGWKTETDEYAKTIYDPCPVGYRMPSTKLWRDLIIVDSDVVEASGKNIAATFKVDANQISVYYPMTGYYTDLQTPAGVNSGAYMWAATFYLGTEENANDDRPYSLDFEIEDGVLEPMQIKTERSNYAMPVRCISRMSKAHVTDLSDYQTANSYMVSKDGYYKFKATVRGNGIGRLVAPGETTTKIITEQLQTVDMSGSLVRIEPLWWQTYDEDPPSLDELNSGEHFSLLNDGKPDSDGYISFKVDVFHRGNLILAGYDAKGDIIWSWHIWFTDNPQMMKSNSFVVMDRNMGATHAPSGTTAPTGNDLLETYGLYYQWGRKDPFVGRSDSDIFLYDKGSYKSQKVSESFTTDYVIADKTVESSVSSPMTFQLASGNSSGVFADGNFFSGFDITSDNNQTENQIYSTMMRPEVRQSLWGYSASSGYGVTTTKTMYDPCPPGYIVTHYLVWTNTLRNSSSAYLYYTQLDGGWISHNIGGTGGIFTTKHDTIFDPSWYPYSGYIDGATGQLENAVNMGVFHTSTPAGNGSRSIAYNSNYSGQLVDGDYWGLPSSFAYPVRCQKE